MSDQNLILALAKVLVAAAWADGQIATEELNSLKDLLFQLPGLTASDWVQIEIYLDSPVDAAERQRLVSDLENRLSSEADKQQVMAALDQLVQADGVVSPAEAEVINEIKASIDNAQTGQGSLWNHLVHGRVARRSQVVANAPNREDALDDFIQNYIYYEVKRQFGEATKDLSISDAELRKLSLAGGLMARVAYADQQVSQSENDAIIQALKQHWQLSDRAAAVVAKAAEKAVAGDMDYYRLTRSFFEATDEDERLRFLDVLFAVAASDGQATFNEVEEIRTISSGLLLSHKQFIDAKMKLPPEKRPE
jgi:uncharacterized tellurite resistance protein B-like protein